MGRFLFVGGDAGGDVPPVLAVVAELASRGHDVDYLPVPWMPRQIGDARLADSLRQRARAAGARPVSYDAWEPTPPGEHSTPPLAELAAFDNVLAWSFYAAMAPSIAQAVEHLLAIESYDAVAIDMGATLAAAACEAHGVPYVILVHTIPISRWWPGRPCPGTGRRLTGDRVEDERLSNVMDGLIDATWLEGFNRVRSQLGLHALGRVSEVEDRAAVVLVMTEAEFDHGSQGAPANYRYVGSCVPVDESDDTALQVLDGLDDDRPVVVMSPTTTSLATGQIPFIRASIEALASLPVSGVITVGRSLDPSRFAGADNVTIAGHVPHGALLRRASVMITHCGHGTVMTALRFGVPLIGLPDFADQRDIAARIADHGVGIVLEKPASTRDIRRAVETILTDSTFAAAASRFALLLAQHNGPRHGAAELERASAR